MDLSFKGFLFDLDGTLVDSSEVIYRAWAAFAQKHRINVDKLIPAVQGKPALEAIKAMRPDASDDSIMQDAQWLENLESKDTRGVIALPGAIELLNQLNRKNIPWAIVTSGTLPVATARIKVANLPFPEVLVTPELVSKGKPHPDPYLLGAGKLGLKTSECLVLEDAPAGVASGVAAGATVIGMLTQFDKSVLLEEKAVACFSSLLQLSLSFCGDEITLSV